ncbi:MAG: hypothetical protein AAB836_01175 [Patescibacteria group bacterium]
MNKKLLLSALIITSIIAGCSTENLQGSFSGAKSSSTTKSGLKLSIASPAVDDQLVYGGQADILIGKFSLKAANEDYAVSKITLENANSGSEDSIKSLKIKYPTSLSSPTTLDGSSSVTFSGTTANFVGLNLMVAKGSSANFEVYVSTNIHADDSGASDTGDKIQMNFTTTSAFEATGQTSGKILSATNVTTSTLSTEPAYIFRNLPEITVADTSIDLEYGAEAAVFDFTVQNSKGTGPLSIRNIGLDVSSSGLFTGSAGLGGTWKIVDSRDGTVYGTGVLTSANKGYVSTSSIVVEEGSSTGLSVLAPIVDDGTLNTNTLSVRISSDSSQGPVFNTSVTSAYGDAISGALASSALVWTDRPTSSSVLWHNGYEIEGLPTSYVTST